MPLLVFFVRRTRFLGWVLSGVVCATLVGCQKESGPTRVSGQVTEMSTGQPVPNAQVHLTKFSGGSGGIIGTGGGGYSAQGTPYVADGQGRFAFTFNAESHGLYGLRAEGTYYLNGPNVSLHNGQVNEDVRVKVYAATWLRFQLVDELPKGDTRGLYITGYDDQGVRLNNPHDTILVRQGVIGFINPLYWSVIDSKGVETSSRQNVNPRPLDTLTVRIPF